MRMRKRWGQIMTKNISNLSVLVLAGLVFITPPMQAGHHGGEHIKAALESADRPAADKERDEARKPAEVLAFSEVTPGMTVVDLNAGDGWYSEVLSRAVGSDGKVYSHNGPFYWGYVENQLMDAYNARFGDNRLANVELLKGVSETLDLPEGSVDVVITALAYHDYFYLYEEKTEPADVAAILASIKKALKPGGSFVVIDHVAPDGTGTKHAGTTHRIEASVVQKQVEAAGFKLSASSDVLANSDDDLTKLVFDPSIRGKTDRFVYKFTKAM